MLNVQRWRKEKELMAGAFPQFRPFADPPWFGFQGHLLGRLRRYEVVLESREDAYPETPPSVYMNPQVGSHWRISAYGRPTPELCVIKDWIASHSTFANTLLAVVKYLEEHHA